VCLPKIGIFPDFGRRVDKNIFINEIDFFFVDIVKVITQMKMLKQLILVVSIIVF